MSGYNVTTPRMFGVKDPIQVIQFDVAELQATIIVPDKETHADNNIITADQLLGGYVIIDGQYNNINLDIASNIISTLRVKLQGIANDRVFPNGTSFKCVLYAPNQNVTINNSVDGSTLLAAHERYIASNRIVTLTLVVVDQASLGNGHSDEVRVCACGGNSVPVPP